MRITPLASLAQAFALAFTLSLAPMKARAEALPFATPGEAGPLPVFTPAQTVTATVNAWRVEDAEGRAVARGSKGDRLPTTRCGAFRLLQEGKLAVSYAVIPDVAVRRTDRTSPFAMGAYFSMRYSPEDLPRAAELLRRMGATASRDELRWDLVEPEPGRWTWEMFDRGMVAQHEHNIEPLGLLDYWGAYVKDRPERTEGLEVFSDAAVKAFANYCREAVRRYRPGGSLAKRMGWTDGWGVRHWEVWNEPATFWSGTPEQFGRLHRAAHAAIKAEQPDAVVHFSNIGPEWDARALHVAGLKSFEGLTPHYYSPPRSPDDAGMDRQMRETVRWYRQRGLKANYWVSEVGWHTTMQPAQEMRQAQYLVRAYAMALDAGMDRVFWYNFRDDGPPGENGLNPWYGVVRQDLTPKPAYAAYAAMVARLTGKKPAGRADLGPGVAAVLFSHRAGPTAVVWADRQDGSLPPIAAAYWRDTMGNPGQGDIPLNDGPVYVIAPGKSVAWLKQRLEESPVRGIVPRETRSLRPVIPHSVREAPTMEEFWATAPAHRLDTRGHVVGLVPWSPEDLSAEARFLYDETGLWMRIVVTDDVFHQPHTGQGIWEADSVQVAVSADGRKAAHEFGYALTPEGTKAFRYGGTGGAGTLDVLRSGNTVTYDIRIPWAELAPLTGRKGELFRMDFMVNESDGHGRRGWLEFTPGIGTGNDPALWAEWTLGQREQELP